MNTRIQQLKIENYKKKLALKYSFLSVDRVFYGNEDQNNNNFSKKIVNSNDTKIEKFSIYDTGCNAYVNEVDVYEDALKFFKKKIKNYILLLQLRLAYFTAPTLPIRQKL